MQLKEIGMQLKEKAMQLKVEAMQQKVERLWSTENSIYIPFFFLHSFALHIIFLILLKSLIFPTEAISLKTPNFAFLLNLVNLNF